MRYSVAATSLFTALAVASPLHKKGLEVEAPAAIAVEIVTNVVMVTVTAEPIIVTATAPVETVVASSHAQHYGYHTYSQAAPAPVHTTSSSSQSVVVVTVNQSPATSSSSVASPVYSKPSSSSAAPAASTTPSAATGLEATAVSVHSNARASHSASAMTWNATLAGYAAQEGSCTKFEHILSQGKGAYGQNIAVAGSTDPNAYDDATALKNAMDDWYGEEKLYGSLYGVASPSESVGDFLHFTQMVWQASTTVGCAVVRCGTDNSIYNGMYIWYSICDYYPVGNVLGSFDKNVLS